MKIQDALKEYTDAYGVNSIHRFTNQLTPGTVAKTINSLKRIKDGKIVCLKIGICGNLDELVYTHISGYGVVAVFSVGWEHHTGEETYPVPNDSTCSLWEGQNLEYRISLIDYMINKLKSLEF